MSANTPTARGDRAQRRIDVLDAASSILEESGWSGLNMREVARRAGVSAGALYQWFAGKDEIFGELYAAKLREGLAFWMALGDDLTTEQLLRELLGWVTPMWRDIGRWTLEFGEVADQRDDRTPIHTLADIHTDLTRAIGDRLRTAARREGRTFPSDSTSVDLVWAVARGIGEQSALRARDTEWADQLIEAGARALAAGLTESA